MPVYLFTFHAYRSWNADDRRGFVSRGKGVQSPNQALAQAYNNSAKSRPALFGQAAQRILLWIGYDVCQRRGWRLHYAAIEPSHVHYLVSWNDELAWQEVSRRLKNVASTMLGRKINDRKGHWFSRSGSRKRVCDRQHFEYLMEVYLPRHKGLLWREGQPPPVEPPEQKPPAPAGGY